MHRQHRVTRARRPITRTTGKKKPRRARGGRAARLAGLLFEAARFRVPSAGIRQAEDLERRGVAGQPPEYVFRLNTYATEPRRRWGKLAPRTTHEHRRQTTARHGPRLAVVARRHYLPDLSAQLPGHQ